nr:type I polyketide synthase [uncultured Rhodopila sp.]
MAAIAIIGMACEFPGAHSPEQLWQNVLAGRRHFRRAPKERLPPEYFDPDPATPGTSYADKMAVLEGWQFDPLEFRIPPVSFEASDMAHWLALYVARAAIQDSGIDLSAADRSRIGVVLGNTLTGEFSRSHNMRHRWPYTERSIRRVLDASGLDKARTDGLLLAIRNGYEGPLPQITEDSLAGNMANTIAGRICGYFDLGGGGYIVDGACSSSLLSIARACGALIDNEMDVALAGGVDVSLDPFEVVGFAKAFALARDDIRPYDEAAEGMLPGEGCGIFVLMREEDARAQGLRVHAVLRGWGISSDGAGGITAPEVEGQMRALNSAYRRAGYPIGSVGLIEGHGTGTALGDKVEIAAVLGLLQDAAPPDPIRIGSIKAQIGHCKAAAGSAGLIKAVMALKRKILPPTFNCVRPSPAFGQPLGKLRPSLIGSVWETGAEKRRASVSAMGFGGANAHVTLEEAYPDGGASPDDLALLASAQSSELILLSAATRDALAGRIEDLIPIADRISRAELTDLSAALAASDRAAAVRAALVTDSPWHLAAALRRLLQQLRDGTDFSEIEDDTVLIGVARPAPRLGALFPGQGTHRLNMGEHLLRRFPFVRDLHDGAGRNVSGLVFRDLLGADEAIRRQWELDLRDTRAAQPAIVVSSIAMLQVLAFFGLKPSVCIGHSLGEITALHAAGAFDAATAVALAGARGMAMSELRVADPGAMLAIAAPAGEVERLLAAAGSSLSVSNFNSRRQTVVSGGSDDIAALRAACAAKGLRCTLLPVSHAFHSDIVAPAAAALRSAMQPMTFHPLDGSCISTCRGGAVPPDADLKDLLSEQLRHPVRFVGAVAAAQRDAPDLWIEIGPGGVLTEFLRAIPEADGATSLRTDVAGEDGFLLLNQVLARAFVLGFPVATERLFEYRFHRDFDVSSYHPVFITNPCERLVEPAPGNVQLASAGLAAAGSAAVAAVRPDTDAALTGEAALLEFAVEWIAKRTGFPKSAIGHDKRFRDDLNLDSIKVGELVVLLSRKSKQRVRSDPGTLANATLAQLVASLHPGEYCGSPADGRGLGDWVRPFRMMRMPAPIERDPARAFPASGLAIVVAKSDSPRVDAIADVLRQTGLAVRIASESYLIEQGDAPANLAVLIMVLETDAGMASLDLDPDGFDLRVEGFASRLFGLSRWALAARREDAPPLLGLMLRPACNDGDTAAELDAGAGFVRSLRQEHSGADWKWVAVPAAWPPAAWADQVLRELAHGGRAAVAYEPDGERVADMACLAQPAGAAGLRLLSSADVALVSGGAKGITFELALELARRTGCKLALIGSSPEPRDAEGEHAANLRRLRDERVDHIYLQADITDLSAVQRAAARAVDRLGPVTAVLHGAGVSVPRDFRDKPLQEFLQCVRVKARGLYNLLRVAPAGSLKALHVISSVLGHTGMRGQTDYAFANAWLDEAVRGVKARHPSVHCLSLGYSVWSGTGLGHKANLVDGLRSFGVAPISAADGVGIYGGLLEQTCDFSRFVITGSLPAAFEVELHAKGHPPRSRFLEKIVRYIPGVELAAESVLSRSTDLYLDEHVFAGTPLFPGVMAIEAMIQTSMACADRPDIPVLRNVVFSRPLAMPGDDKVTLRIEAQADLPDNGTVRVRVVVRSDQDNFRQDHFAAECWFGLSPELPAEIPPPGDPLDLNPEDFSPSPLFQGKLFRRIVAVREHAMEDSCVTDIAVPSAEAYFRSGVHPSPIVTCPAVQDAFLQSGAIILPPGCLPVSAAEFRLFRRPVPGEILHCRVVVARTAEGYRGNLTIWDSQGYLVETVADLVLKETALGGIRRLPAAEPRVLADVVAELQRFSGYAPVAMATAAHTECRDVADPRRVSRVAGLLATRRAAVDFARTKQKRLLDPAKVDLMRRRDGKPELCITGAELRGADVTMADAVGLSVSVVGLPPIGVDIEAVEPRNCETWLGLLGVDGYDLALRVERETGETFDTAATRVWTLFEAGRKAQGSQQLIPAFDSDLGSTWVAFRTDTIRVLSVVVCHPGQPGVLLALSAAMPLADHIVPQTLAGLGYEPDRIGIAATNGGPRGQFAFHQRFPVSFRNAQSFGGKVYFTNYADWLGTVREFALAPVRARLTDSFAGGIFALATNHFYMRVWGDAKVDDVIEARLWIDAVSPDGGIVDFSAEWSKLLPGGATESLAYTAMRASHIEITGHGEARLSPPPDFLRTFLLDIAPEGAARDAYEVIDAYDARTERVGRGEEIFSCLQAAGDCPLLHEEHFQTALEDSNVVGNVYFSGYPKWIGRTCDLFFHKTFAAEFGPSGSGEWFTLVCDIDHLQEAMPYDEISVRLHLDRVLRKGLDLRCELYLKNGAVLGRKLAVARLALAWVPRQRDSALLAEAVPAAVLNELAVKASRPCPQIIDDRIFANVK